MCLSQRVDVLLPFFAFLKEAISALSSRTRPSPLSLRKDHGVAANELIVRRLARTLGSELKVLFSLFGPRGPGNFSSPFYSVPSHSP